MRILRIAYTAIRHYSTLITVLKCDESFAAAKAATLISARKRQHLPQGGSIEVAATRRRQQWPQQATPLATAAGSSTGHSAQAAAMAVTLAAARTRQ